MPWVTGLVVGCLCDSYTLVLGWLPDLQYVDICSGIVRACPGFDM